MKSYSRCSNAQTIITFKIVFAESKSSIFVLKSVDDA